MFRFFLSRIGVLIPTFVGVAIVAFSFIRLLPGDPVLLMAGERGMSPERHAQLSAQLGFDQPLPIQFWHYLVGLFQGDFGQSIVTRRPVLDEFLSLFPATIELATVAILLAVLILSLIHI